MIITLLRAAFVSAVASSFAWAAEPPGASLKTESFETQGNAEVIATITASCAGCDWGRADHEAAALRLEVDGRYSQHLFLTRGAAPSEYRVLLGSFQNGRHTLTFTLDSTASAKTVREASVSKVSFQHVAPSKSDYTATSLAPIVYARPNTVGHFTDTPLLMWYEVDKTERGTRIRYSVIFSNEDGGTPADRLLATWGRLTDIEYVYGIELDATGKVLEETFQGKDHEILNFRGQREGRHPLLYVITDNNMVKDSGTTMQRAAPAPIKFDLTNASREIVMDENPWTYAVAAAEARREGRVVESPAPGSRLIVDPSRYAVLEACSGSDDSNYVTFAFSIGVAQSKGAPLFFDSKCGVPEYRINRSATEFPNGCFRGAVALPKGTKAEDVVAVRVRAEKRVARNGEPAPPQRSGPARLRHINRLFLMDASDLPGKNLFSWSGDEPIVLDTDGVTIDVKAARGTQRNKE